MDASTWTTKEKYMSAFWLLCSATLVVTIYIQKSEITPSSLLQDIGLIFLIFSWASSPQLFLQPLKVSIKKPVQKSLLFGLMTFFVFQLASSITRYMV